MKKLASVCIERPVFAAMLILCLVVVGTASYTLGGATHTAKYLEVFRKGADGKWQYVADAFSGVAPAAGSRH